MLEKFQSNLALKIFATFISLHIIVALVSFSIPRTKYNDMRASAHRSLNVIMFEEQRGGAVT